MQARELLNIIKQNLNEAELAYQQEPCEERLQEVLQLQARVMELEQTVYSQQ